MGGGAGTGDLAGQEPGQPGLDVASRCFQRASAAHQRVSMPFERARTLLCQAGRPQGNHRRSKLIMKRTLRQRAPYPLLSSALRERRPRPLGPRTPHRYGGRYVTGVTAPGAGREQRRPLTVLAGQRALAGAGWRVKDSNLRSFRDGFTVRSHWPLGQPAGLRATVMATSEMIRQWLRQATTG